MRTGYVAAVDLGASSGRVMLCDGASMQEAYRFVPRTIATAAHLQWDFPHLLAEVKAGICAAAALAERLDGTLRSVGIDTWGVDFGLLGDSGALVEQPGHYRSPAASGLAVALDDRLEGQLYTRTGLPPLDINTLTQMAAIYRDRPEVLAGACKMLPMADLLAFYLTGSTAGAEISAASTTQMLMPDGSGWNYELLHDLGLGTITQLLPPLRRAGTVAGQLNSPMLPPVPLVTVAAHDTASAIYTTGLRPDDAGLFLSCGTWGLLGILLSQPLLSDPTFSNERCGGGEVAYLQNIPGMWLLQETRRQFEREGDLYTYDEMEQMARSVRSVEGTFGAVVDVTHPDFATAGDIPSRLCAHLAARGQTLHTRSDVLRCVYESLVTAFAQAARQLSVVTGRPADTLHLLGGGTKDTLLRELLAQALPALHIVCGRAEASAWGNALMQLEVAGITGGYDDDSHGIH